VSPGSHRFDPAAPETTSFDRRVAAGGSATAGGAAAAVGGPRLRLALPAGSVAVYALHLLHRGSANTAPADRPFYFFTLKGPGCAGESTPPLPKPRRAVVDSHAAHPSPGVSVRRYAPPGLAYTIEPSDIARWSLHGTALLEQAQRC